MSAQEMSTLTETRQTPHNKLKNQIANDYRAKGYVVTTEKCIGNRRVDIFAENDKETLIIEVVDTHYSGPLDEKLLTQLKVTIAKDGRKKLKKTSLAIESEVWTRWLSFVINKTGSSRKISEETVNALEKYMKDQTEG